MGVGDVIAGRYRLDAAAGAGGMGEVFRAFDQILHRTVALKRLRPPEPHLGDAARQEFLGRARREARTAAALHHPNVVTVFDFGEDAEGPFVVMEWIPGESLRTLVRAPPVGADAVAARCAILADVARALAAAHQAGIVHRDVKPDNVVVRASDGVVKVLDFGIARRASDAPATDSLSSVTASGVVVGTPAYMAPEQLRARDLDGRADQFAWAVTAYELLTGGLPWGESSGIAVVAAVLSEQAEAPSRRNPSVSAELDHVILRALAKDRSERFASMDAIVRALSSGPADVGPVDGRAIALAETIASMPPPRASTGVSIVDAVPSTSRNAQANAEYADALRAFRDACWGAALQHLVRTTELDSGHGSAWLRRALAERCTHHGGEEVRRSFRRALDLRRVLPARDRAILHALEPWLLSDPVDGEACVQRLDEATVMFPDDAEILELAAFVRLHQQVDVEGALGFALRAVAVDPSYADGWQNVASAHAELDDLDAALAAFERACEESPGSADVLWERSEVLAQLGRAQEAEVDARRAIALDPGQLAAYGVLASALFARGRSIEAVRETLRRKHAAMPTARRPAIEARDEAFVLVLEGRFSEAERAAAESHARLADSAEESLHAPLVTLQIELARLRGDGATAARVATFYLERAQGWIAATPLDGATPLCIAAAQDGGAMTAEQAQVQRNEWIARAAGANPVLVWARAFLPAIGHFESLRAARASAPWSIPLRCHHAPSLRADVGELWLRIGEPARAHPILQTAARTVLAMRDPIRHLRAKAALAECEAAMR